MTIVEIREWKQVQPCNSTPPANNKGRETLLTISLIIILGGSFVFFLNLVSLGIFAYVMAAIVGMATIGFLHYALWGYALSKQVAGEREEERIKEMMEGDEKDGDATQ